MGIPVLAAAILFHGSVHAPAAVDTVSLADFRAEFEEVFNISPVPRDDPGTLVIAVRKAPAGDYLAAFQREHGWILTFLVQHGLSFDLEEISNGPGSWEEKVEEALAALKEDQAFESLVAPVVANFLDERGLALEGYPPTTHRDSVSFEEMEELTVRFLFPDGIAPDGTIQVHICTNLNAVEELRIGENLLMGAFAFAAVRNHMQEWSAEFEEGMEMARAFATASDPATDVARAQGALWSHLIFSGAFRSALLQEWEQSGRYFPFEMSVPSDDEAPNPTGGSSSLSPHHLYGIGPAGS